MLTSRPSIWAALTLAGLLVLTALTGNATGEQADAPEVLSPDAQVRRFAGRPAERCVFATPGTKLCRWSLEGHLIGTDSLDESPLALHLICEVAIETGGEPRCDVHPVEPVGLGLPPVGAGGPGPAVGQARVLDRIATARTTTDISRVLGDIPEVCYTGVGVQRCEWQVPAESAAADTAMLACELPLDGSARATGSCELVEREAQRS